MRYYEIENEMYQRAMELIEKRYPVGWGGAGVIHTSKGNYFTSVSIETANASAIVCIELGAMLEAHKYNEKVTHCMCLIRDNENSPYRVLWHLSGEIAILGRGCTSGSYNQRGKNPICGIKGITAISLDESLSG